MPVNSVPLSLTIGAGRFFQENSTIGYRALLKHMPPPALWIRRWWFKPTQLYQTAPKTRF